LSPSRMMEYLHVISVAHSGKDHKDSSKLHLRVMDWTRIQYKDNMRNGSALCFMVYGLS
jgi:hypothetical protein